MSHETYLHRSFDYQLSPVPSGVIDWAETRRAQRTVMPSSSGGGAAASQPLVETAAEAPWVVPLTTLEKAAQLEAQRREQRQRQLQRLQQQQQQYGAHQQQQQPANNTSMYYYVEEGNGRNGGAHQQQQQGGRPPSSAGGGGGGAGGGPAAPNSSNTNNGGSSNDGSGGGGGPPMVMYPTDGSVYAATTPEGEVLSLYAALRSSSSTTAAVPRLSLSSAAVTVASPSPTVSAAAAEPRTSAASLPPAGGGRAAGATGVSQRNGAPVRTSHTTRTNSPDAAATAAAGGGGAVNGGVGAVNGGVSPAGPSPSRLHTVADTVLNGALVPAWRAVAPVLHRDGNHTSHQQQEQERYQRPSLDLYPRVSLSDYVWGSYGCAPLWRRSTFAVSAGVYAAFGLTRTEEWTLRQLNPGPSPVANGSANGGGGVALEETATALLARVRGGQQQQQQQQQQRGPGSRGVPRKGGSTAAVGDLDIDGLPPMAAVGSTTATTAAAATGSGGGGAFPLANIDKLSSDAVEVGAVHTTQALRVMNVLQLEWFWARLRWQGVLNLRLLPASQHTRMPLCEYVMRTPWTEWSVQSDELVFNWSAFLTLYQRHAPALLLEREQAFQLTYGAALRTEAQAKEGAKRTASGAAEPTHRKESPAETAKKQQHQQHLQKPAGKEAGHKAAAAAAAPTSPSMAGGTPSATKDTAGITHQHQQQVAPVPSPDLQISAPATPPAPRPTRRPTTHWWALRHLKVGAGIAVKNDLASGLNLYWGFSGQTGRGLSFSGHIDVLRRMCCAASSSLGPLDLSVRLRVNLITFHRTALDAGVCYRPFAQYPNTILRASTSATGRCAGVQIEDATHEFCSGWIASHAERRVARRMAEIEAAVATATAASMGGVRQGKEAAVSPKHTVSSSGSGSTADVDGTAAVRDGDNTEGGWISFGWASSAWGYLRGKGAGSDAAAGANTPTAADGGGGGVASTGSAVAGSVGAMPTAAAHDLPASRAAALAAYARAAPQLAMALPTQWYHSTIGAVRLPPEVTARAAAAAGAARVASVASWRGVTRLDWLESLLDSTRVGVSAGVTHDPNRPGSGFSTFLVISAH